MNSKLLVLGYKGVLLIGTKRTLNQVFPFFFLLFYAQSELKSHTAGEDYVGPLAGLWEARPSPLEKENGTPVSVRVGEPIPGACSTRISYIPERREGY